MPATKRRKVVGLCRGRVTWDIPENLTCIILAQHGLHGHAIAQHTGLTVAQVYYRCRKASTYLTDYRNGYTLVAKRLCSQYTVNHVQAWVKDEKERKDVCKRIGMSWLAK